MRVEVAKAQAAVKEAEAQWRAVSAQREKARERQRCHTVTERGDGQGLEGAAQGEGGSRV